MRNIREKSRKSEEDYLETILIIQNKKIVCRGVDIVDEMNFKKSSVSVAVKKLKEQELVFTDNEGYIKFTDKGRIQANRIWDRHRTLKYFLIMLGIDSKIAEEDACEIEHVISEESFNMIKERYCKELDE